MDILQSDSRVPQVLQGEMANLDAFRGNDVTQATLDNHKVTNDELFLFNNNNEKNNTVKATWQTEHVTTVFHDEHGKFYITTERILFVSSSDQNHNFAIDAACIQLHAVSDDVSLYIQIQEPSSSSPQVELTVTPSNETQCQELFEALSKLVSMHPIPLDDNDDDDDGFMDEAIFAPPPATATRATAAHNDTTADNDTTGDADACSEQERNEMLQRLDDMLVVPPQYEIKEEVKGEVKGQFDDAEEEKDEDDAIL